MPAPSVWIYEVVREWTSSAWLCDACAAKRRAAGWNLRSQRLPPPLEVVVVQHSAGDYCPAMLEDRVPLRCQDCHLAGLPACPACGGPVIFPGAIGLNPCEDPSHVRMHHVPAELRAAQVKTAPKRGRKKPLQKPPGSP